MKAISQWATTEQGEILTLSLTLASTKHKMSAIFTYHEMAHIDKTTQMKKFAVDLEKKLEEQVALILKNKYDGRFNS